MDSRLYEELCRFYLADQIGVPVEDIASRVIENPQRPGDPELSHQIDHYWETGSDAVLYVNIANAKWRTTDKADQGEILAVHAVKELIRAHKALLITSTEFTKGARGLAAQHGIGLHVVRPKFEYDAIPLGDRETMRTALSEIGGELYTHEVVHRGLDPGERPRTVSPATRPSPGYFTRQVTDYTTRGGPGPGATNQSLGSGRGGYVTRDGGGFTRGVGGFERR